MRTGLPSSTALFTLSARAAETRRPPESRFINDPYAARFLSRLGLSNFGVSPLSWLTRQGGMAAFVAARHRLMDDVFLEAFESGVRQFVNLGCGFDSRLFRFQRQFSEGLYLEVDHPSSFRLKSYVLDCEEDKTWQESCHRISIDFQEEELGTKLIAAGFEPERESFVFWEGVSYYLDRDSVHKTLASLSQLIQSGSQLVFDYWDSEIRLTRKAPLLWARQLFMTNGLRALGEPLKTSMSRSQLNLALSAHGFRERDHIDSRGMKNRYLSGNEDRQIFNEMPVVVAERA